MKKNIAMICFFSLVSFSLNLLAQDKAPKPRFDHKTRKSVTTKTFKQAPENKNSKSLNDEKVKPKNQ